uniref:Ig-like domain-containing protein n=1 Tax=Bubo bubo TaxID=30461 RepID=A0A8C0FKA1_BUBBB
PGPPGLCPLLLCRSHGDRKPRLRAPGDSVLLSCRGDGFNFGNYHVFWYRQRPGDRLEWVSYISRPSGTTKQYGAAVQGRVTASRDNSRSESQLSLRALGPRDSARYFCAWVSFIGFDSSL